MAVTKDQIADVLEKHVSRFGYQKTTVDEIAGELGISKKTLYLHFDSKREMYAYVVDRIARESKRVLAAQLATLPTNREKVIGLARIILATGRQHVMETSEADWRAEYEVAADALTQAYGSLAQEYLVAGIEDGEFAFTDAVLARRMVTAMLLEYTFMVREDESLDLDEELVAGIGRFLG